MRQGSANGDQGSVPAKEKLTWGEKRDRRRRNRKMFEEVMAWVLVPALLYIAYVIFQAVGGIPKELVDFATEVFATVTGGRF